MPGRIMPLQSRAPTAQLPVIILWSGSEASIPAGFHLCDGTHDTPDLRDQFVWMPYFPGDERSTFGVNTQTTTHAHATSLTDDESTHTHGTPAGDTVAIADSAGGNLGGAPTLVPGFHDHSVAASVTDAGNAHLHGVTSPTSAYTQTSDIRPPYLALCYIQGAVSDLMVGGIVNYVGPSTLVVQPTSVLATLAAPITATATTLLTATPILLAPPFTVVIDAEALYCTGVSGTLVTIGYRGYQDFLGSSGGFLGSPHLVGASLSLTKYVFCDGSAGSPNLANGVNGNCFVLGAGGSAAVNDQGGVPDVDFSGGLDHFHDSGTAIADDESAHGHYLPLVGNETARIDGGDGLALGGLGVNGASAALHGHTWSFALTNPTEAPLTSSTAAHGHVLPPNAPTSGDGDFATTPQSIFCGFIMRVS